MAKHTIKKALKSKSSLMKKVLSGLLTTSMVMGMCALYQPTTLATTESTDSAPAGTSKELLDLKNQEPSGFKDAKNPYGYDEGVPFNLSTKHEILYYGGWDGSHESKQLNGENIDDVKDFIEAPNKKTDAGITVPNGTWNWIETVAFDNNTNNTKDNKVLFLAVKSDKDAYAWVLDYTTNTCTTPLKLGNMSWLGNGYDQYSSTSLFSVAAGDFNGDGIDTLLVYTPLNLNDTEKDGCSLFELSYNGSTLTKANKLNHLLMDNYIKDQNKSTYKDHTSSDDTSRDKLSVSMQVGDFNGDGTEDLGVLSYSHKRYSDGKIDDYIPQLKVCYGKKESNFSLATTEYQTYNVSTKIDGKTVIPVAASLAAGNFNNDNICDLYIVGVKASANSGSQLKDISVDGSKWYTHAFIGSLKSTMTNMNCHIINSNAWFEDGFYKDDNTYGETLAAGVALSGKASSEMLFIAGSLYNVFCEESSDGTPVHIKTISYFTSGDEGASKGGEHHLLTNTFMQSVITGNFDGNDAGREQVVYIVGAKQQGQDDYYFLAGTLWGTDFNDTKDADGNIIAYGAATKYDCTSVDDDAAYIHYDKGDDLDEGLGCFFTMMDWDDDAIQAKYLGVNYFYTDPTVLAVLQAAPYFKDLCGTAPVLNSTSYSITTSYSSADTDSDALSGRVGLAVNGKIPLAGQASATIGIKGGFTSSYTESYETSYTKSFAAGGENLVITSRTPMFVYKYDIFDNITKKWSDSTQMEICMPQSPYTVKIPVDEYNEFAEAYNNQFKNADYDETEYNKLQQIDKDLNWMANNEGNPYGYNHDGWNGGDIKAQKITAGDEPSVLGKSGGLETISKSEGNSVAEDFTSTVGFYAQETITFGSEIASYGVDLNGEYEHGFGHSETTGESKTLSFSVADLSTDYAPKEIINCYNFKWTCGSWERHLGNFVEDKKTGKKESVPTIFLGYNVADVTSLPAKVTDLTAVGNNDADPEITLSWSKPESYNGGPQIDGYVVYYVDQNGKYIETYKVDKSDTTKVTLTKLADNVPIEFNTDYSFVVKSYSSTNEAYPYSDVSNIAKTRVSTTHTVNLDYNEKAFKNMSVLTQDNQGIYNVEVSDGDRIEHGKSVDINATTKENYYITKMTITDTVSGTKTDVGIPESCTSINYDCVVTNDIKIKIETEKIVSSAHLTYTKDVKDTKGTIIGKISASTDGFPVSSGAIVSDPITFTATPKEGYALEEWNITADDETYTYKANGSNELTLPLIGKEIYVTATFINTDETYRTITVNQPAEGGKIVLYDQNGTEITDYNVKHGTEVTFVAVPDTGYKFIEWTGDVAGQTSEQFTMNVTNDITVGVVFKAPVKYPVTYTAVDEHGNTVTPTPYVASGGSVAAGTEITFKAKAAEGYRVDSFTFKYENSNKTTTIIKQYCTEYNKPVIIKDGTVIEVSFVESQHTVNANLTGKGKLTVLQGNRELKNGDKVEYMSSIKLIAKPDKNWKLSSQKGWKDNGDGTYTKEIQITKDIVIDLAFMQHLDGMFGNSLSSTPDEENSASKPDGNSGAQTAPQTGENPFTGYCIMILFAAICAVMIASRKRNA